MKLMQENGGALHHSPFLLSIDYWKWDWICRFCFYLISTFVLRVSVQLNEPMWICDKIFPLKSIVRKFNRIQTTQPVLQPEYIYMSRVLRSFQPFFCPMFSLFWLVISIINWQSRGKAVKNKMFAMYNVLWAPHLLFLIIKIRWCFFLVDFNRPLLFILCN